MRSPRCVTMSLQRPGHKYPTLLLLTGLPLLFNEDFSLEGSGSPAWDMLRKQFYVLPIGAPSDADLAKGNLLLMAQPQAQSPENLVALDNWVRRGGRVLLLADPMLEWPSKLPAGRSDTGSRQSMSTPVFLPIGDCASTRRASVDRRRASLEELPDCDGVPGRAVWPLSNQQRPADRSMPHWQGRCGCGCGRRLSRRRRARTRCRQ